MNEPTMKELKESYIGALGLINTLRIERDAARDELSELRRLVWRVVTGDGAQLENLSMTVDEFTASAMTQEGMIEMNVPIADIIEMAKHAERATP